MEALTPNIASVLFVLTLAVYSLLVVFILVRVYHDAENRGINGLLVVIPTFLSGTIFGTILWLVFRPSIKPEPVLIPVKDR
jgi:uncharacterized membrane protein YhaH (DUF805 family)